MAKVERSVPPGRLMAWTLVSRTRYALFWAGLNTAFFLGLEAANSGLSRADLAIAMPVSLLAVLLHARFAYPRAKRRFGSPQT